MRMGPLNYPFCIYSRFSHGGQDMSEPIDYEQLIEQLLAERADIDRMIAWARKRQAQSGIFFTDEQSPTSNPPQPETAPSNHYGANIPRFPRLAQDTFFRMSVPDAIKKYLNIAKRPKTAKDITTALDSGGLTHQAKNLYATVYPTLMRMEGANEVVRVGKGEWGLSDWYPSGRKASLEEKIESES
jgi:hypothetical protein